MRLWHVHYYVPWMFSHYWIIPAKTAHQARLQLWGTGKFPSTGLLAWSVHIAVQEVVG
jgi:hypothetical protein